MQQPGQVRRRGAWDFQGYYDYVCAAQGSTPVPAVQVRVGRGELDLNADRVQQSDWPAILDALSINTQLQGVAIRSAHLSAAAGPVVGRWSVRRKTPALHTRGVALALCRAVRRCLAVSGSLRTLELSGLSLREADLTALTKGLMKSAALEHLSLARCPIADRGLEVICQGVKFSSSIKTLDFSYCNITWQGAEHLANIIKHQAVCRHSAAWAESLRYRKAEFEVMAGLRRLTLNGNILIGDEGAAAIARELAEDLWVKAVDLQRCGLSNVGGTALLQAVQSNRCLCVLDVRNNPLVDNSLVKDIITRVLMNTVNSSDTQYLWIKPPTSGNPVRNTRRASHRTSLMSKKASGSVPWRTAARAGLQNAATSARTRHDLQGAASVKVALESEEEEELEEVDQRGEEKISSGRYGRLKVALEECRLRLTEERNARMQANSRLVELELENARLRSQNASLSEAARSPGASVLLDDALLDSVEGSFSKFHSFLNLLCEAGLGQLASMAGIQQADLAVLGRPRPSSPQAAREEISLDLRSESLQEAAGSASPGVGSPHTEAQPGPTSSPAAPEEEPSSPSSLKSRRHAGSHGSGSHGSSSRSSASSRGYVEALHITSF